MYISIDANNIGKKLECFILTNELKELNVFSNTLNQIIMDISNVIEKEDGIIIMAGGDNILAHIDKENLTSLISYVYACQTNEILFSIGLGETATCAYMALKYSKAKKCKSSIIYDGILFSEFN